MAALAKVDELIERYHQALSEFMKGDPDPVKKLWSHREDASLTNPQGSVARGWIEIAEAMDRAASTRRDGKFLGFETVAKRVSDELAYVVEVDHLEAKVHGGRELTPYALRVTMIFGPEEGVWKVVHRHADQITTPPEPDEWAVQS
jgi:ketosteroid isomerase-like protein